MPTTPQDDARYVLVYDVGGSHVSGALCVEHSYALVGLSRAPLPVDGVSAESFGELIHGLGEAAAKSAGVDFGAIAGASLAIPGPFDYANGVSQMQHKLQSLFGVDLKSALATRFGWEAEQVGFVNDAGAFLLGEVGAGAAKGAAKAVGITLGTGIGCAFASGGGIAIPSDVEGGDGAVPPGGEIWNLPYDGAAASAGGGATVEDFVSTRYLRGRYRALTGLEAEVSEVAAIAQCRENLPCKELEKSVELTPARRGSVARAAREVFDDFGRHLGLVLNQHAGEFKPEVIVLGGGIARASSLFLPATLKAMKFPARIVISALMDEAPLAGAGVHWFAARG